MLKFFIYYDMLECFFTKKNFNFTIQFEIISMLDHLFIIIIIIGSCKNVKAVKISAFQFI